MRCPTLHRECKHEELLPLIVERLAQKARVSLRVQLLKVKSHIGIGGNKKAGKLALDACRPHYCTRYSLWKGMRSGKTYTVLTFPAQADMYMIHNASGRAAAIVMDGSGEEQAKPGTSHSPRHCWPVSSE